MVDQLRREAAIKRINVSQAIEDIKVSTIISSLGHQPSTCHFFPFFCCSNDIWLGAQKTRGKKPQNVVLFRIDSLYFFFLYRSSYLIMRTRTTCWWDFLPKNPTHSGRNLHAVFSKPELSSGDNKTAAILNPNPPFLALWLFLMFRSLLIAVLERTQLSGIKSVT